MPRIEHDAFQRERKKTKEYMRLEGTAVMYIQEGTEALLTVNVERGPYKGEEVEVDASPFIGDVSDSIEGMKVTILARPGENGAPLGRYIHVERKRDKPECFEGSA